MKTYNSLTQEEFIKRVQKFNPNLDIISEYHNAHNPITYHCNICGFEETIKEANSLLRGITSCGCCSGRKLVIGVNDFGTKFPQLVKYFKNVDDSKKATKASEKKFIAKCPICGNEREYNYTTLSRRGFSCNQCSDNYSYPNKFMYCLLKQLGVEFVTEKSFNWSKRKIYDFVIYDKNIIIEMDGKQHDTEKEKENDKLKEQLAISNGYNLYRIDAYKSEFDYIKKNTESMLSDVFDLNQIDWCTLEQTISNMNFVKIACDIFNDNVGKISIIQMYELANLTPYKFCHYLKIGARLGLCDYNSYDSHCGKYDVNKSKRKSKQVFCLTNDTYYNSAREAEKVLGLSKDSVARVCRGERISVHNLRFVYVNDK